MAKHPNQPIVTFGPVKIFKANKIIDFLFKEGLIDMNKIAILGFPDEDHIQLAQLLGYSLSEFAHLSYVSDEVRKEITLLADKIKHLNPENVIHSDDEVDNNIKCLKAGNLVRLKSGGPLMTVDADYDSNVNVDVDDNDEINGWEINVFYTDNHEVIHKLKVDIRCLTISA